MARAFRPRYADQTSGQETGHESVPLTKAKATLSDIVRRARDGEPTQITAHGQAVAQIVPLDRPKEPIDFEALRRLRESMTGPVVDSEEFWRSFREDDRY